jgi:hypothetical protein
MPATPARIGFILEEFRRAVAENATVQSQYGALARKSEDPAESFFDAVADAQAMTDERLALLSAARRRFTVQVTGADEALALTYAGTLPVVRYTDTERDIDRAMLVGEIAVDLGRGSAAFNVWG